MGMGDNGNVESHSCTSLVRTAYLVTTYFFYVFTYVQQYVIQYVIPTYYIRFQRLFSRWTWISRYQNVSVLDFIRANDDGGR